MKILLTSTICLLLAASIARGDDGLFDDSDSVETPRSAALESKGDLARGLGKGMYLRSLSAEQFQEAIDERLENREERVEMYYELKDIRRKEKKDNRDRLTASQRRKVTDKITDEKTPDRLAEHQIETKTGQLHWPSPLDHKALKPYRKPIEDSLAKRAKGGETYGMDDYVKVSRMIELMEEAVESIEDRLDVKEVVALKDYLTQIDYEARFNRQDERVDL